MKIQGQESIRTLKLCPLEVNTQFQSTEEQAQLYSIQNLQLDFLN
jgi:hypothetical protein